MDDKLENSWHELCDKLESKGYRSLSETEKTWFNIRIIIDSIENGGLISYFYNSGADTVNDCLKALDELGEISVKNNLIKVCSLFAEGVPSTMEERNKIIESWEDNNSEIDYEAELEEVDENLMPLLEKLDEKLDRFLFDSGIIKE